MGGGRLVTWAPRQSYADDFNRVGLGEHWLPVEYNSVPTAVIAAGVLTYNAASDYGGGHAAYAHTVDLADQEVTVTLASATGSWTAYVATRCSLDPGPQLTNFGGVISITPGVIAVGDWAKFWTGKSTQADVSLTSGDQVTLRSQGTFAIALVNGVEVARAAVLPTTGRSAYVLVQPDTDPAFGFNDFTFAPVPRPKRVLKGWFVTPPPPARGERRGWFSKPIGRADASAVVTIDSPAATAVPVAAQAQAEPLATAYPVTAHSGEATLLGEGTVAAIGVATAADASISIDGTGADAITFDAGFPYTFPFTFGGNPPVQRYLAARATVDPSALSDLAVAVTADAVVEVIGSNAQEAFPYTFPITLG